MKLLTDSYYKEKSGSVTLSGRVTGAPLAAQKRLCAFSGGAADVTFLPINDEARALVKAEFDAEVSKSDEAYVIDARSSSVKIYANGERAKVFAAYSTAARCKDGALDACVVYSTPKAEHRSVRVFLPPKSELNFFLEYLDTLVELGYNAILLEIGGAMEFKKHPEINETWAQYCRSMAEFNEKVYTAQDCYKRVKNSIHTFNAGGDVYSQEELRPIIDACRERCIEIIPEVPSLSHSEYILISHPEMRECDDEDYASTACPQNEDFYKLVFELFDEVIDVFAPKILHIGHDEWWVMCVCDKCKDKDAAELFAYNITRCYEYLKSKGVKTMLWADKLKAVTDKTGESHGAARKEIYSLPTEREVEVLGKTYHFNQMHWYKPSAEAVEKGFLHVIHNTEAAIDLIPKDVMCVNWYYSIDPEINDIFLRKGLYMIYGNCVPAGLGNVNKRLEYGARGFSVSSWTVFRSGDLQLWNGFFFEVGYGALISWDASHSEYEYEKNAARVRRELYLKRNESTLKGDHLKAVHRLLKKEAELEPYFTGALPYCEDEKLTLGEYVVEYKDGSESRFPVLYTLNVSIADAKPGRAESTVGWSYGTDTRLDKVVPSALPVMREDGFAYECVFPVGKDAVNCRFEPKEKYKNTVEVLDLELVKK